LILLLFLKEVLAITAKRACMVTSGIHINTMAYMALIVLPLVHTRIMDMEITMDMDMNMDMPLLMDMDMDMKITITTTRSHIHTIMPKQQTGKQSQTR